MSNKKSAALARATAGVVVSWVLGTTGACVLPEYDVGTSAGGTGTTEVSGGQGGTGAASSGAPGAGGGAGAETTSVAAAWANVTWLRTGGGDEDDDAVALAASPKGASIWVGGSVGGPATFMEKVGITPVSPPDEYALTLDEDGLPVGVSSYGAAAPGDAGGLSVRAISFHPADGSVAALALEFSGGYTPPAAPVEWQSTGASDHAILCIEGGSVKWAAHFADDGSGAPMTIAGLTVVPDGDVIVAGTYSGKGVFSANAIASEQVELASKGGTDVFVARLSGSNGGTRWAKSFGSAGDDVAYALAVHPEVLDMTKADKVGVWVAGRSAGGILTDLEGAVPAPIAGGGTDAFVIGFDATGSLGLAKLFGDAKDQQALGLALEPEGTLVLAGDFAGGITFDETHSSPAGSTSRRLFAARLDAFTGAATASEVFSPIQLQGPLVVVPDAPPRTGLFVAGSVAGKIDIGGVGWVAKDVDGFVAHLGSAFEIEWCQPIEGDGIQRVGAAAGRPDGSLLVAGSYADGMMINEHVIPPAGQKLDMFVMSVMP